MSAKTSIGKASDEAPSEPAINNWRLEMEARSKKELDDIAGSPFSGW